MTLAAILLATALFFVALQRSNLIALSWSIVAQTSVALHALRENALDDDARERAAQTFAVHMFGLFGRMAVLSVLVCAAPLAILTLFVFAGVTDSAEIWRIGTSWPFIAANIALFAVMLKRGHKA